MCRPGTIHKLSQLGTLITAVYQFCRSLLNFSSKSQKQHKKTRTAFRLLRSKKPQRHSRATGDNGQRGNTAFAATKPPPPRRARREVWWPHYLGESAETAETAAIIFELAISAASGQGLPPRQTSPRPPSAFCPGVGTVWKVGEGGAEGRAKGGGEGEQEAGRFSKCYTFEKVRVGVAFSFFCGARGVAHNIPLRGYARKFFFLHLRASFFVFSLFCSAIACFCCAKSYRITFEAFFCCVMVYWSGSKAFKRLC